MRALAEREVGVGRETEKEECTEAEEPHNTQFILAPQRPQDPRDQRYFSQRELQIIIIIINIKIVKYSVIFYHKIKITLTFVENRRVLVG